MKIGNRIKFHRINKGMTQGELSEGIISKSYLSKIENDQALPANEIIAFLCERLEITYEEDTQERYFELINKWFEHLLKGNKKASKRVYQDIFKFEKDSNLGLRKLYEIHKIRFFVLIQDREKAKNQIKSLRHFYKDFTRLESYYWHKFLGDYYYLNQIYETAFDHYRNAEMNLDHKLFQYDEEKNDLNYLLSITASQLWKFHHSIYYSNKALSHYQNTYDLHRCAQCQITLGIAYKRMGELDKAIESYNKAFKIAKSISKSCLLATCHQNLGSLYFERGDIDSAIKEFFNSFELKEQLSIHKKLVTIKSLITLFYQERRTVEASYWLQQGNVLIKGFTPEDSIIVLDLKLYDYLLNGQDDSIETFILEEVVPLLKKKRLDREIANYYKILADYYYEDRKYKNACIYYQKSSEFGGK